jgi:hypothetical protein
LLFFSLKTQPIWKSDMAVIVALGITLAFILFGALERLVPKAGRLLGALSGITFVLLALWGLFLGSAWGFQEIGMTTYVR